MDTACRVRWFCVFRFNPVSSYPLPFGQCPRVALGSAPLRGHRMTFGHSSKDPLRPLSQGEKVGNDAKPSLSP